MTLHTTGFALAALIPALCNAQPPAQTQGQAPVNAAPPSVYSNPRAGSDDPRVGLKGGLYDAGEAAFGMEKIATLPKPPGFAPGETPTPAVTEPPPEQPGAPGGGRAGRGQGIQY